MPWREKPSAYLTVVSEFMLQQTQVATVIPYFNRFVKRFNGFRALAMADASEVLAAWSGLGYYRRARLLKQSAEQIVAKHWGQLPSDPESLAALPGFGPYTVAAVGSIACGWPLAAVDGNVKRVLARWLGIASFASPVEIQEQADRFLDTARPGDWNQAMMELGATICLPRSPRCGVCPVSKWCAARISGNPERFPQPKAAPRTKRVEEIAIAMIRQGKLLLLRRAAGGSFERMWELPGTGDRKSDLEPSPSSVLFTATGRRAKSFKAIGVVESTFTHHRIATKLFHANGTTRNIKLSERHDASGWFTRAEIAALPMGKTQRRLVALILEPARF